MKKLIFAFLLCFTSCGDVYRQYSLIIDNRTDDTIRVVFSEGPYAILNPEFLIFPPKQEKILFLTEKNATRDGCGYIWITKGDVAVYASSGRELQKEIWNADNWECRGSYQRGWEHKFVVTEDDLE